MTSVKLSPVTALLGAAIFVLATSQLRGQRHHAPNPEIEVALPVFVQVAMSFGDRYWAANLGVIRALVTDPSKMSDPEFAVMGIVQRDAAWLNPAHEDNYYIAAGILPWYGQLAASQSILRRASMARPFDYQPPFFYAFNLLHFEKKPLAAAEWLRQASENVSGENERIAMQELAARWVSMNDDLSVSAQLVEAMAKKSKNKLFRSHLEKRAERLRILLRLRAAVEEYSARMRKSPQSLKALLDSGVLKEIPADPLGGMFILDETGRAVVSARRADE